MRGLNCPAQKTRKTRGEKKARTTRKNKAKSDPAAKPHAPFPRRN